MANRLSQPNNDPVPLKLGDDRVAVMGETVSCPVRQNLHPGGEVTIKLIKVIEIVNHAQPPSFV